MTILETAIRLLERGYSPILTGPTKSPGDVVGKNWQTYEWTPARFETWLDKKPDSQLGLMLGDPACPLVDVEIDAEGLAAVEALTELTALMGDVRTPSWNSRRGPHHLFKLAPDQTEVLRAKDAPSVIKLGEIELRFGGANRAAQSLIPPSTTDNSTREWGELSLLEHEPAELPDAIFDAAMAQLDKRKDRQSEREARSDRPGDVYNERADWKDILEPLGWKHVGEDGVKQLWARPGRETKVGATTGFCETDARPDMLYIFSESLDAIAPFQPNYPTTKFEAYALVNHGGDFAAATRDLAEQGYEPEYEEVDFDDFEDAPADEGLPLDRSSALPPDLPSEVFDNFLGEYVLANDPLTEAHKDAVYMQALELFGNFIGRAAFLEMNAGGQFLNGFLCVIGESGRGRKGTSWNVAKAPFKRLTDAEHENYASTRLSGGLASGEGLIYALRDDADNKEDKRYMAMAPEIGSLMPKLHAESSILSGVLRSAYDGDTLANETKNNPAKATEAHVSMVMHSTPSDFAKHVQPNDIQNGLMNRAMYVYTEKDRVVYDPQAVDSELLNSVVHELQDRYEWVHNHSHPGLALKFNLEAKEYWRVLYHKYEGGEDTEDVWSVLQVRNQNHLWRLAGRFALLDRSTMVGKRHLCMAEHIVDKSLASLRALQATQQRGPRLSVLEYIRDSPNGVTKTDIGSRFGHPKGAVYLDRVERDKILEKLIESKLIEVKAVKPPNGGRPATKYFRAS